MNLTGIKGLLILGIIVPFLGGCLINVKPGGGYGIVVKPTQSQINAAAVKIVCGSFGPIYFSGKLDTAETVAQIRRYHAALKSYGCKLARK